MARVAADIKLNSDGEAEPHSYAASWVDRFTGWVDRLPGPSWSYYLGLGLAVFVLQTAVLWSEGAMPISSIVHNVHAFLAGAIALFLILFHYLDERAAAALGALRPALKATDQAYGELYFQLTTLPARATLLASLAALAFSALTETLGEHYHLDPLNGFPMSGHLLRILYWIVWWIFGAFLYHTVHQFRMINHIYTQHTHIDLFRMEPLYALSNLSALTAVSLTVVPYGFLLVNRFTQVSQVTEDPGLLSFFLVITFLAVATFVWPQLGIHRLQVAEKERLLHEANQRLQAIINDLHQQIDSGKLEGIGELNTAMSTLEMERNALQRIGTWPWEPEVVRLLVTALALPLGMWLIQFILQRAFSS